MGRFEEDHGVGLSGDGRHQPAAVGASTGQEAQVEETIRWQTGGDQGGHWGACPGHGDHGDTPLQGG